MIRTGRIAIVIVLALASPAGAGQWSLEGGAGGVFFQNTTGDGTWRQDAVQEPNTRLVDLAWVAGVRYRFNPRWSVGAHYFDWGENVTKSLFASDDDFYSGRCANGPGPTCPTNYYRVVDRMWGADLDVRRHFMFTPTREIYVTIGGAIAKHELKWGGADASGAIVYGPTRVRGTIPMLKIGGGLCWGPVCWDSNFYTGTLSENSGCIGGEYDCGYPLAKQVVTSMVVFQIPMAGSF